MNKLKIQLELVWWAITAVVTFAVLYPLESALPVWPFRTWNIVFVVVLITFTRYIFMLEYAFFARWQYVKAALMISMIPVTFIFVSGLNGFLNYIEEKTWEPVTGHLSLIERTPIEQYGWNEMIFFGAGCVIAAPAFAVRIFISIWRQHNNVE